MIHAMAWKVNAVVRMLREMQLLDHPLTIPIAYLSLLALRVVTALIS